MKMNKLAAGALALALGLGAVAPAVAAEHTGAELVLERYEEELKEVNKKRVKYLEANEKINTAKARLDAAKALVAEKEKAYKALFPAYVQVIDENGDPIPVSKLATREVEEAQKVLNGLLNSEVVNYENEKLPIAVDYIKGQVKDGVNPDTLDAAIARYENAYKAYLDAKNEESSNPRLLAYQELQAALLEKDAAITNLKEVKAKYDKHITAYENAFEELSKLAGQYGLVVQVGNNGVQFVKPGDDKVKAPDAKKSKEELVKELKAAIQKNKVAIESAEFLLENAPKSVAKVKGKLEDQIVTAKAALAKAEAALEKLEGKKMALVATAYADEDVSVDELESLIKENEDAANAINETIKENEKEQPEVEEEKPEEKPEEKEEDKKEEKKPAKKAGNNARTGIAGVAGVAGILAAASVAYAASKRD